MLAARGGVMFPELDSASVSPADGEPVADATDYAQLFLSELDAIRSIVRFVTRRRRLRADEAEEFASHVTLRLIENDYAILRKFQGRSQLRTYLSVVIQRMFLDWRVAQWGKWRPSALAKRKGRVATELEQLVARQGLTFEEARVTMKIQHGDALQTQELASIYAELPRRGRRRLVGEDALESVAAADDDPASRFELQEEADATRLVLRGLLEEVSKLPPEDRQLLKERFVEGATILEIARRANDDPQRLYRRLRRLLTALRARMGTAQHVR
jgi:RNA polymerase sigma factor for flagellar operon FliA